MRLKRMVPPQALGQGPSPQDQQNQMIIQQLHNSLTEALQKQAVGELKIVGKDQQKEIDAYEAETNRIKALMPVIDPEAMKPIVAQLVEEALKTTLMPLLEAGTGEVPEDEEIPPIEGAMKAEDGEYYLLDPTRHGKYLRLGPLVQEKQPSGESSSAGG